MEVPLTLGNKWIDICKKEKCNLDTERWRRKKKIGGENNHETGIGCLLCGIFGKLF